MIKNIWNNLTIYCKEHEVNTKMELNSKYQYACTCKDCHNAITLRSFEKALDHISGKMQNNILNNVCETLDGYQWKDKYSPIYYEVLQHKERTGNLEIAVRNKKAIDSRGVKI